MAPTWRAADEATEQGPVREQLKRTGARRWSRRRTHELVTRERVMRTPPSVSSPVEPAPRSSGTDEEMLLVLVDTAVGLDTPNPRDHPRMP